MKRIYRAAASIAVLLFSHQVCAQSPHSTVTKTDTILSAVTTCSSGRHFDVRLHWRHKRGITIEHIIDDKTAISRTELDKAKEFIGSATDLNYVQLGCSGDQDGGINVAYVTKVEGKAASMLLILIVRDNHLLVGPASVRSNP